MSDVLHSPFILPVPASSLLPGALLHPHQRQWAGFPCPGPPYQKPYQSQQVGLPNRWVCPGLALPYGLAKVKGYAQVIYEIPLECLALNAMGLKKLERQFLEGCHP